MTLLTAPAVHIYSVTGIEYGKKLDLLFDPPALYRFIGIMAKVSRALPTMTSADATIAELLEITLRPFRVLLEPSDEMTQTVREAFGWYIQTTNELSVLAKKENWRADLDAFDEKGLKLSFFLLWWGDPWVNPGAARLSLFLLSVVSQIIDFILEETNRDSFSTEAEFIQERGAIERQKEIVSKLVKYLERVFSGEERFSLYPPPSPGGDSVRIASARDVTGVTHLKVLEGNALVIGSTTGLRYEDFYYPGPSPTA